MTFTAKKAELDLDLVTLSGENVRVEHKRAASAAYAEEVVAEFERIEKEFTDKVDTDEKFSRVTMVAREIQVMYGQELKWWIDNFDVQTLNEILKYCSSELAGLGKSENS